MPSHPDNNDTPDNGFYSLFQGPKYLLPVKIPAIIIVILLYLTYHVIKFTIEQLVNMLVTLVYCVLHLVTNLFMWIKTQIPLFCMWLYQQIFLGTVQFCYLNVILPFPTWIKKLFIVFRSTCLHIWETILYPLWSYTSVHIFSPLLMNLLKLMSYTYANLLAPLYRWIKDLTARMISQVKLFVVYTIPLYCFKCLNFYGYILLLITVIVIEIISYIYTKFFVPLCRYIKFIISIFYHYMTKSWSYIYTCIVCTIDSFCEASRFFCEHVARSIAYIYSDLLVPLHGFIRNITAKIIFQLKVFIVHTIPLYWWKFWSTCRFILFSINRIVGNIMTCVYTNLLTPLYRCIEYIISTFYYYMTKSWPYIYTCIVCTIDSFCEASRFFCEHVARSIAYIYSDLLVPLHGFIRNITAKIIFQLKVFIVHTIPLYWWKFWSTCRFILFSINRIVGNIMTCVYTNLLTPLYRCIEYIISTFYYYTTKSWPYIYTCIVCTIGSFCEASTFCYEYVLRVIVYIHNHLLVPLYRWIKDIIGQFIFQVKVFIMQTIPFYCHKCLFICRYILLSTCRAVILIVSYVFAKFFVPVYRYIKRILSALYYYAQQSWSYIYTCIVCVIGSFCEASTWLYEYVLRLIAYIHTNIFVPLYGLITNLTTKTISQVKIFIVYTIPLCWSICKCILVTIRQTVVNTITTIYSDFLMSLYRWIKDVILQIYQILRTFLFHVFTCAASITSRFYQYILLPLNHKLRSIGSYSKNNFVIPFYIWMTYTILQVYHYLRGVVRQVGTLLIYARNLMHFCRRTYTACVLIYHEVLKPGARSIMNNIRMFFRQLNAMIKIYYIYFVRVMKDTKSTIGSTIANVRRQIFKAVRS